MNTRHDIESTVQSDPKNRLDIIVAGAIFAAAVGFMLFAPRRVISEPEHALADDHAKAELPDAFHIRYPALVAPESATVH